jgi:enamine deaminase RidA (YjgF/YER057c/UK114 family)
VRRFVLYLFHGRLAAWAVLGNAVQALALEAQQALQSNPAPRFSVDAISSSTSFSPRHVMTVHDKLRALGITLPPVAVPAAAYVPWVRTGDLVFLSGHLARKEGKPWLGQLGRNMTTTEGRQAARATAIDLLGTLHMAAGDLSRVQRIVKVMSLVNSTPDFTEQHLVTNGCSELLGEVFGDAGKHARSAFGVASLPFGACVEIELVAQVA